MGAWIEKQYPRFREPIRELVEEHRQLDDYPLHLALAYAPSKKAEGDAICLFEVIAPFRIEEISSERELMEMSMFPASGFPLEKGESLRLILTSPEEAEVAVKQKWRSARGVLSAIRKKDYEVIFQDDTGSGVLRIMESKAIKRVGKRHG